MLWGKLVAGELREDEKFLMVVLAVSFGACVGASNFVDMHLGLLVILEVV